MRIVRDRFEVEDTFCKIERSLKHAESKFGIIHLPKFYINFENKENRDAFKDVAKEVEYLKTQKVEGIVMDLRNNGGGSLQTVVDMVRFVYSAKVRWCRLKQNQANSDRIVRSRQQNHNGKRIL